MRLLVYSLAIAYVTLNGCFSVLANIPGGGNFGLTNIIDQSWPQVYNRIEVP
jgi:hypothetical protein